MEQDNFIVQWCEQFQMHGIEVQHSPFEVVIKISGISGEERFQAIGKGMMLPREEGMDCLRLEFILAQQVNPQKRPQIAQQLLQLQDLLLYGTLHLTAKGEVGYCCSIPVLPEYPQQGCQVANHMMYQLRVFLDTYYPFILLVINQPEKMTLEEYLDIIMG